MSKIFYVKHSSIVVPEYELGTAESLEGSLSVWDQYTFTNIPMGFHYDEDTQTLYLPRGIDIGFVAKVLDRKPMYVREYDEPKKSIMRLKTPPRSDLQKKSISFITGNVEFNYTKKASQLALTLSTGAGKTYCAIASVTIMRKMPIIITHNNNIKGQWIDAFQKHTDVDERSICDIKGSSGIDRLRKSEKIRNRYKVFVVNRKTLSSYGRRFGWEQVGEFFKELGIGIKIYDEAHIEFDSILKTDFYTNTWKSIYLTANLERSDRQENRVYDLCFKNVFEYGEVSKYILKKHMLYIPVFFSSHPSYSERVNMKTFRGLSIPRYTDYLMDNEHFYEGIHEVLPKLVDIVRKNGNGKIVTMTATIKSTGIMEELLREMFPDKKVYQYNSKLTQKQKDMVLSDADIITTTSKSLGTGSNIEGVQLLINFEPYSSKVTANQVSGRLRPLKSGEKTLYVEFVDNGFPEIKRMFDSRKKVLKDKALKMGTMSI